MRILVSHFSPTPNSITGITSYTWAITRALSELPHQEVFLCTNWDENRIPSRVSQRGVTVLHAPTKRNETLAWLKRSIDICGLEKKYSFDVILTPQYYSIPFSNAARVTVVHDFYLLDYKAQYSFARHVQWNLVFPVSLARSHKIICISEATRRDLLRHYPYAEPKSAVVREASTLCETDGCTSASPVDCLYGLMVANIEPTKNVDVLFRALELLARRGKTPQIVLVGSDRTESIKRFRSNAPGINLIHIPRTSEEGLISLYKNARFYVNTSLAEGFCLPILEAQTFGVPVICSDLPVLHEVAGEGALFFNPQNAEELAGAMNSFFDDSQLVKKMSYVGTLNCAQFSWHKAANETLKVFEEAIEFRNGCDGR